MRALNLVKPARRILLETERLVLRRYEQDDLDRLDRLNRNVEVMRYIGDGSPRTREQTRAGLVRTQRIYDIFPGLGFWIGEEKPRCRFVGVFALIYIPHTVEVEVGYRLAKSAWGRGLATEAARAALDFAFDRLALAEVIAMAVPANAASRRVMDRLGMQRDMAGDFDHPRVPTGQPLRRHVLYRTAAPGRSPAATSGNV